jgi:hypothetical protein
MGLELGFGWVYIVVSRGWLLGCWATKHGGSENADRVHILPPSQIYLFVLTFLSTLIICFI